MPASNPFHLQVKKYLKLAKPKRTQFELANELAMESSNLTHLLTGDSHLREETAFNIVKLLVDWHAFTYRQEVEAIMKSANYENSTLIDWTIPPFSELPDAPPTQTAAQPRAGDTRPAIAFPVNFVVAPADSVNNLDMKLSKLIQRSLPVPPAAPDYFGGRDDELADLKKLLKGEEVVTLTAVKGLGGIGKTTLAQRLASDLYRLEAEKHFATVFWTEINRRPDTNGLLMDWALMADPTFIYRNQSPKKFANVVKSLLNDYIIESSGTHKLERSLVVFDDVWDNGIDTVEVLREACPDNATILITTRSGKAAKMLSKNVMQLDMLEPAKGVELLKEYLKGADEAALFELAEVLHGHALALTLAARRLMLETEFNQAELLQAHINEYRENLPKGTPFDVLELEQGEDREKNLSVALFFSYDELSREEQRYFRALGSLPYNAPFDEPTLRDIWKISMEKVRKVCQRLRLLSLIDEDKKTSIENKAAWYRQHPVVRSYALALLKKH